MATTVSNLDREIDTSVSEESVPLLGLALEDAEAELAEIRTDEEQKNDQSQARIMAFQGSTELQSIIQAKDTPETMVVIFGLIFSTHISTTSNCYKSSSAPTKRLFAPMPCQSWLALTLVPQ